MAMMAMVLAVSMLMLMILWSSWGLLLVVCGFLGWCVVCLWGAGPLVLSGTVIRARLVWTLSRTGAETED